MTRATIYRDYDQAALNAQYDQTTLVPDTGSYIQAWHDASVTARAQFTHELDISYGAGSGEKLDVFPARAGGSPTVIFVHGGAWLREIRSISHYPRLGLDTLDVCFVAAGFTALPAASLAEMVAQVRRCIKWVYENCDRFGGDCDAIYVIAHSSGGHLAAMSTTGCGQAHPVKIAGRCLVSGIYDLEPVRLSARNDYLQLDPAASKRLTPLQQTTACVGENAIFWGADELDEFKRQSHSYYNFLAGENYSVSGGELAGQNHFDMANAFAEPGSAVCAALHRMINTEDAR